MSHREHVSLVERQPDGDTFVNWRVPGLPAALEFVVEPEGRVSWWGFTVENRRNVFGGDLTGPAVPESWAVEIREAAKLPDTRMRGRP